jgi:hypothetical protein
MSVQHLGLNRTIIGLKAAYEAMIDIPTRVFESNYYRIESVPLPMKPCM